MVLDGEHAVALDVNIVELGQGGDEDGGREQDHAADEVQPPRIEGGDGGGGGARCHFGSGHDASISVPARVTDQPQRQARVRPGMAAMTPPATMAAMPPMVSQMARSVGEPEKNLDTSEAKESAAEMPQIRRTTPTAASAKPRGRRMVVLLSARLSGLTGGRRCGRHEHPTRGGAQVLMAVGRIHAPFMRGR